MNSSNLNDIYKYCLHAIVFKVIVHFKRIGSRNIHKEIKLK